MLMLAAFAGSLEHFRKRLQDKSAVVGESRNESRNAKRYEFVLATLLLRGPGKLLLRTTSMCAFNRPIGVVRIQPSFPDTVDALKLFAAAATNVERYLSQVFLTRAIFSFSNLSQHSCCDDFVAYVYRICTPGSISG